MIFRVLVTNHTLKTHTHKAKQNAFMGWILSMGHQFVTFVLDLTIHCTPHCARLYYILCWSRARSGKRDTEGHSWTERSGVKGEKTAVTPSSF